MAVADDEQAYTRSWEGFHCYIPNGGAGSNWLSRRRIASRLPAAMFSPQRRAGLPPPQALLLGTELLHTVSVHRRQQAIGRRRLERRGIVAHRSHRAGGVPRGKRERVYMVAVTLGYFT
jgi:hypothetical protein